MYGVVLERSSTMWKMNEEKKRRRAKKKRVLKYSTVCCVDKKGAGQEISFKNSLSLCPTSTPLLSTLQLFSPYS